MIDFFQLKKIKRDNNTKYKCIKVALLCDSSSQWLKVAIKGYGLSEGLDIDIYEASYNQIELLVFNKSSELYQFKPEFVIIAKSAYKLLEEFQKTDLGLREAFADNKLAYFENLFTCIENYSTAKIIFFNLQELNDGVYGHFANSLKSSFIYNVRKLNLAIMDCAQNRGSLSICDVQILKDTNKADPIVDPVQLVKADMAWSLGFIPYLAKGVVDIIKPYLGKVKKCLIFDLDNTIWGGIIGEDGMNGIEIGDIGIGKAFTNLQLWIRELKTRGIILCVASKNDEHLAKEVFIRHPDMILRLEDITVFAANWENKVTNINKIRDILNIGFDSMVFIDDNPFEREMVRSAIENIVVPELPQDPVEYLSYLVSLNLFEINSFTDEDRNRSQMYKSEVERQLLKFTHEDESLFLRELNMVADISQLNEYTIPRAAQLSQRSNQFNLRTIRYSENDLQLISTNQRNIAFTVSLSDRFGDYGMISLVILEQLDSDTFFIDTWLMSCRVLKRGVERFVMDEIILALKGKSIKFLVGEYIPTDKNRMVSNHYSDLGFAKEGDLWRIEVSNYSFGSHAIQKSLV